MLDTDTCIYLINRRDRSLQTTFQRHAEAICISAISHAELCYGVEHSNRVGRNRHALTEFLSDLDVVSFDQTAGTHYGQLRETLTREGTPIGGNDLLIAAHARSIPAVLVTNNEKEFGRVPDLETENWLAEV
ncbi:MAG: type II toxin-antitoxin system VapC family toxin [Gammaproteobacteria bacterium]|nr:type II toxin-antitoxin system VapC family toxin [Gammaproteobacteria bacterium]